MILRNKQIKDILYWFDENKRDLIWRKYNTPYSILISEVMLQQTKATTVVPYFKRFMKALPDFWSLAEASDEILFKLWEGLGYYNRVKNLKRCAKVVVEKYNGVFPRDYELALALPGVGIYTCGAILSRAYNLPYAAVDGNVLRVFSRYLECKDDIKKEQTKKKFKNFIEEVMPKESGKFNESLMEIGATICMPKITICEHCPLQDTCSAYKNKTISLYPVKQSSKEKTNHEYMVLFLFDGERYLLISKPSGVLKGQRSPLLMNGFYQEKDIVDYVSSLDFRVKNTRFIREGTHVFTHQIWYMRAYVVLVDSILDKDAYTPNQIKNQVGVPTCFRQFFLDLF